MKLKKITSLCCFLLAALMVMGLAGCGDSSPSPTPTPNPNLGTITTAGGEITTADPNQGGDDPEGTVFPLDKLKETKIIFPLTEVVANGMIYKQLENMQKMLKNKFSVEVDIQSDYTGANVREAEYEILIGNTTRDESDDLFNDLRQNDYGYAIVGTKIIIKGGSDAALKSAITKFTNDVVLGKKGKTVFYTQTLDTIFRHNYEGREALTLNGTPISQYAIVYPATSELYEQELAIRAANHIALITGNILPCYSDATAAGEHEILIGQTNRAFSVQTVSGAALEADNQFVMAVGSNSYEIGLAQERLEDLIEAAASSSDKALTVGAKTEVSATEIVSFMAYNLYGFDVYQERCNNLCTQITKYLPDIISFQEPAKDMMGFTGNPYSIKGMNIMGDYYEYYIGLPRYGESVAAQPSGWGGANSVAPILYAKDRYEPVTNEEGVVEGGTKWMTSTPDTVSKLENSSHYRIYTYLMLRDKVTGKEFIVVNHHLDFDDPIQNTTMRYMFKFFNENYTDIPVVMLGDFNANASSTVISNLIQGTAGFTSLHQMADTTVVGKPASIDWIFGQTCCVTGVYYTVGHEVYRDMSGRSSNHVTEGNWDNREPSDHSLVYGELIFKDAVEHTHNWTAASAGVEWATE